MANGKRQKAKGKNIEAPSLTRQFLRYVTFAICLLTFALPSASTAFAEDVRDELPTPTNLQAVVLKKAITLSWAWQAPEELPAFTEFGYEIKRQDGKTFRAPATTWIDAELAPGTYGYMVRARGMTKEKEKPVIYVSDWAGPVDGTIKFTCQRPPTIELSAEPTQKQLSSISSLRFHLQGQASVDKGCTLETVTYHLDTGAGVVHTGSLAVDDKGHFDTFVNAYGPEDELPTGHETFSITAKAEDEAGPTTSNAYSLDLDLKNPYAPDKPYSPENPTNL